MMSNYIQAASQHEHDAHLEPYEAYQVGARRQRKMMLINSAGHIIGMPAYAYAVDALCTSPGFAWLLYTNIAFRIKGQNLPGELMTLLQDDRIRVLYCFSPARHYKTDPDAVVIDSITRHSFKEFGAIQTESANDA